MEFKARSFTEKSNTDSLEKELLDTRCSKTVVVALGWKFFWIHTYEETIKNVPIKSAFRFSDGAEATRFKKVTLNIVTGQENTKIDVEIVDNIPALNSKGAMKQLGMKLDFKAKL